MTYQLISVSGEQKGKSWPLSSGDFMLGRDDKCYIQILDAMVSRKHCMIKCDDTCVKLQDLQSRNETLINGLPSQNATLNLGDKIAIGSEVFILASGGSTTGKPSKSHHKSSSKTVALLSGGTVDLSNSDNSNFPSRPRTIHELARIYRLSQRLTGCVEKSDLNKTLLDGLKERFNPLRVWIGRVYGIEKIVFDIADQPESENKVEPPLDDINRALSEKRGLLLSSASESSNELDPIFTLISPVVISGASIAVIVLQTSPPNGIYNQDDLDFLTLLAQFVAPFIKAHGDIEYLQRDNERLRSRAGESVILVGKSPAIEEVREQISRAAPTTLNVLISGETGTGKELAARMIHQQSQSPKAPLIIMNCAAIPSELFESTLFGHLEGSFTGATKDTGGLLQMAHGGILFLDEIGDLNMDNQAKILRAIEHGTFHRVGGKDVVRVDVRFVAATNKDLNKAIEEKTFRKDLYYRLKEFELFIPPLRDRPIDIPILANHFFEMSLEQAKKPLDGISDEATQYLCSQEWIGNVRELSSSIHSAVALAQSNTIEIRDIPKPPKPQIQNLEQSIQNLSREELERLKISKTLDSCDGNVREAARILGMGKTTLYSKIREFNIK